MTKTIMILAIAVAFVAGSILTGTMAFAGGPKTLDTECNSKKGTIESFLCEAIFDLQEQIANDNDQDPTNELQTLSDNGGVTLSDGGGIVSCAQITGDASLCDGNDAIDDADNDSSNEIELALNGGTTTCADITGGAGLCDGDDAVVDADSSTTNELQTLSEIANGLISLSNGGGSVTVQDRVTGTCTAGSSIRVIAANGGVTCETDDNTVINVKFKADGTCAPTASIGSEGWCPDGSTLKFFTIFDSDVDQFSLVLISLTGAGSPAVCSVNDSGLVTAGGAFQIGCTNAPNNGATLKYVVLN